MEMRRENTIFFGRTQNDRSGAIAEQTRQVPASGSPVQPGAMHFGSHEKDM
ncbi:unnamed protein product, partial [marine sediment metagenome]